MDVTPCGGSGESAVLLCGCMSPSPLAAGAWGLYFDQPASTAGLLTPLMLLDQLELHVASQRPGVGEDLGDEGIVAVSLPPRYCGGTQAQHAAHLRRTDASPAALPCQLRHTPLSDPVGGVETTRLSPGEMQLLIDKGWHVEPREVGQNQVGLYTQVEHCRPVLKGGQEGVSDSALQFAGPLLRSSGDLHHVSLRHVADVAPAEKFATNAQKFLLILLMYLNVDRQLGSPACTPPYSPLRPQPGLPQGLATGRIPASR